MEKHLTSAWFIQERWVTARGRVRELKFEPRAQYYRIIFGWG
jgi:hypothetical protein